MRSELAVRQSRRTRVTPALQMQWLEWDWGVPTVPAEMARLARQRFGAGVLFVWAVRAQSLGERVGLTFGDIRYIDYGYIKYMYMDV
jgi:hypothetical protein